MPNKSKSISLYPLKFEEAIEALLKVKPEKKEQNTGKKTVNKTEIKKKEIKKDYE